MHKYVSSRMYGLYDDDEERDYTRKPSTRPTLFWGYGKELTGNCNEDLSVELVRDYFCAYSYPDIYESELPENERSAVGTIKYGKIFQHLSKEYPNCRIISEDSMNVLSTEVICEPPHIDGWFAWWPGCSMMRVVVAIQANKHVSYEFPISAYTLYIGDYVGYDYDRAVHYTTDDTPRVVLSLYYTVMANWVPYWLEELYRGLRRKLCPRLTQGDVVYIKLFLAWLFIWTLFAPK